MHHSRQEPQAADSIILLYYGIKIATLHAMQQNASTRFLYTCTI